jgi:hypothetical protein
MDSTHNTASSLAEDGWILETPIAPPATFGEEDETPVRALVYGCARPHVSFTVTKPEWHKLDGAASLDVRSDEEAVPSTHGEPESQRERGTPRERFEGEPTRRQYHMIVNKLIYEKL